MQNNKKSKVDHFSSQPDILSIFVNKVLGVKKLVFNQSLEDQANANILYDKQKQISKAFSIYVDFEMTQTSYSLLQKILMASGLEVEKCEVYIVPNLLEKSSNFNSFIFNRNISHKLLDHNAFSFKKSQSKPSKTSNIRKYLNSIFFGSEKTLDLYKLKPGVCIQHESQSCLITHSLEQLLLNKKLKAETWGHLKLYI